MELIHIVVCDGLNELELSEVKKFVRDVMLDYNIGHITMEIEFECERCKEDNCEFEMRGYLNVNKTHHHHHQFFIDKANSKMLLFQMEFA